VKPSMRNVPTCRSQCMTPGSGNQGNLLVEIGFLFISNLLPRPTRQLNSCIPLTRTAALCGTGTGRQGSGRTPRTPINQNSVWIDASQVGRKRRKWR
jgi:hypothetical protein